jgi:hypothetical protein
MIFKLFLAFLYVAVFVAGVNVDATFLSIIVSFLAICLGLFHLLKNKEEIKFPKYFPLMLLFLLILQIYLFFIPNKLNPFYSALIVGEGILYWLIFFNLKNGGEILKSLLIRLSLIYSLLFFLSQAFNINLIKLAELYFQDTRHFHIGDLWAFTIVALICIGWKKYKLYDWLTIGVGCFFLAISNTRSALFSLALGVGYYFAKKVKPSRTKIVALISFLVPIAGFFTFSSLGKTTLFDRPYFLQSIESFSKYPFGIGMGNFKQISKEFQQTRTDNTSFSIFTHNIFLETISGVGVFSVVFLLFLFCLIRDILKANTGDFAWGAVVIAIVANFMIDTTYTIPGLVWILFMSIGAFQTGERKSLNSS